MEQKQRDQTRKRFSRRTYLTFACFVGLALGQWLIIILTESIRKVFRDFRIGCSILFGAAMILFCLFVFVKSIRSHRIFSWMIAIVIVELHVLALFILVARSWLADLMGFFFICLGVVVVALIVGCNLSFSMDMTEYIAPLFITSFILISSAMYFLVTHVNLKTGLPYGFLAFQILVTIVLILFVMMHAQTIKGDRFIQMSTEDALLAALLLFHEFLAIFALTFYWQINFHYFSPANFFWKSTMTTGTTRMTTAAHNIHDDIVAHPQHNASLDDYDIDEWLLTKPNDGSETTEQIHVF